MTLSGMAIFASAYAISVAVPGPGIAAIVARALGNGMKRIAPFIAGCIAGDMTLLLLAALGLAVVAQTYAGVMHVVRLAGAAYLLYLAWKLWTSPVVARDVAEFDDPAGSVKLFLTSYSFTLGNPKAIVFFLAILPSILDLGRLTAFDLTEVCLLLICVNAPIVFSYALAAARARMLFRSAKAIKALNRGTGTIMAGAAVAIATH